MDDITIGRKPTALLAATLMTFSLQFPASAETMADGTLATGKGDLAIHAIHHAAMLLTFNGTTILVDPAPAPGAPEGGDVTAEYKALAAPDVILVTHEHPDHFNVDILEAVSGKAKIIAPQSVADKMPADLKAKTMVMKNGDKGEIAGGVPIEAVPAYNTTPDRLKFHPKGRDNGYVLTFGGERVYIAGDTEGTPEMLAMKDIDAVFLPMNLPYTMDIQHAAEAVKAFKPKIVYPYHYGDSDVNAFKTLVGDASEVRLLKWY